MGLNFADKGTITTDGTEQELFAQVAQNGLHSIKLHLDQMANGDILVVKLFNWDDQDGVERRHIKTTLNDLQDSPTSWWEFIASKRFRATVQLMSGTNFELSWERVLID